jgi:hypothetical protein
MKFKNIVIFLILLMIPTLFLGIYAIQFLHDDPEFIESCILAAISFYLAIGSIAYLCLDKTLT